jgi:hypothetical protein
MTMRSGQPAAESAWPREPRLATKRPLDAPARLPEPTPDVLAELPRPADRVGQPLSPQPTVPGDLADPPAGPAAADPGPVPELVQKPHSLPLPSRSRRKPARPGPHRAFREPDVVADVPTALPPNPRRIPAPGITGAASLAGIFVKGDVPQEEQEVVSVDDADVIELGA